MPCHHDGTLEDREELLLKLFDMDEITNILMFRLNPSGDDAGAPSAAPATQNEAAPKSITRRQTSADLYEGAPSAAPATRFFLHHVLICDGM